MITRLITHGFVIQTFDGDKLISQEFIETDSPQEYEDENGDLLDVKDAPHVPIVFPQ